MSRVRLRELNPTGSLFITGSFGVQGQTTLVQTETQIPALLISGAIEIVQAQIQAEVQKAKLTIENLGSLADRSDNQEIDMGGFF